MAINKKKTPEVNAGSMADIAFLLLIFFLVATTMNVDSGINRTLPPWVDEEQQDAPPIKERNILKVFVSAYDQLMVQGEQIHISQLKDKAKEFMLNPFDDPNLPEKEVVENEILGSHTVSKGVISLKADRSTTYNTYVMVQNELSRAFNEIRDELSIEKFGKPVAELTDDQRKAVNEAIKLSISEAEPRDLGAN
ncbi:MAG: biopolymer transporter ExbD [Tidjanibacter sp.]|jgi:biopolymer transport protein ExbD|nr:biopolymer transporter ExbD [Tidjanibacter sp.]